MESTIQLPQLTDWATTRKRWSSLSLRTKILISLAVFMSISIITSMVVYVIATDITRGRLQSQQLSTDIARTEQLLVSRERDLRQAVQLLANDPKLRGAIESYEQSADPLFVLDIDRRVLPMRDRFQIDQMLIIGTSGSVLANITNQSRMSGMSFDLRERFGDPAQLNSDVQLLSSDPPLLVARSPIEGGGAVIAALSLPEELLRIRSALDLPSHIDLLIGTRDLASSISEQDKPIRHDRQLSRPLLLGERQLTLQVGLENPELDSILNAGRTAMLLSSLVTFAVLMLLGIRFSRTITSPVAKLTRVADAIAAGDWHQRAALLHNDEIGRLGRAFDHATQTITSLLSHRDDEASQRKAILQSITDGVLAIDSNERLLIANATARAILGWPENMYGQQLADVLERHQQINDGSTILLQELRSALCSNDPLPERHLLLAGRDVRLSCAPVRGRHDTISGAVAVLQDISEEVATDRAKTQFIGTASHEFRTPLASIKGFVDLLYLQGIHNWSEDQLYALDVIKRQTGHLVTLVNDMIEVARLEQGQSAMDRHIVSPTTPLHEVLAALDSQFVAHNHQLHTEIAPSLPYLWIDSGHLRRVLSNVIVNAIKFTPNGGIITVRVFTDDYGVRFEVEDTGVGIDPNDQGRVFDRFFRSENRLSVQAGGTGLGLSIAKSMVELHHGQIGLRSEPNQGTCFWVSFPVASGAELNSRHPSSSLVL